MAKIISISNHKGGVGKTTTALCLGAGLARKGHRVLLVDLDTQQNLSLSLSYADNGSSIYEVFAGSSRPAPIRVQDNLDIIPSSPDMVGAEDLINKSKGGSLILGRALQKIAGGYDFILLDTPPALGAVTFNALACSDYLIIPLQAHYYAMQGVSTIMQAYGQVKDTANSKLRILGVLLTMYDRRKTICRNAAESLHGYFQDSMFNTTISENVALIEAGATRTDIFTYNPTCKGARDYAALVDEVLTRI